MGKLLVMLVGVTALMFLSHRYYPMELHGGHRNRREFFRGKSDIFVSIAIFWLTCFMFLRTDYNDTWAYIRGFQRAVSPGEFIASGELWHLTGNPLFYFYQSLMRSLTDNYHLYFLPVSWLICWSFMRTIKHYSRYPYLSVVIFLSLGTYVTTMAAMKQGIATSILLLSIPYALDKKYVRFYLLVFLAMMFHTYAFIFVLVPFLCGKPWNLRTWAILGCAVFALLNFDRVFGDFVDYAQSIGAHAHEGDVFSDTSVNALRVAVYLVPPVIALVFRDRLFRDSRKEDRLFVNLSILSGLILMLGLADGANMMARMAAFFEVGTAIAVPWMIKRIFNKGSAQVVTGVAMVLYFGFFLYEFGVAKPISNNYTSISLWQFVLSLMR